MGSRASNVRVPNERDDANTTKVEVQFPAGFLSASYEPTPGWTVAVKNAKLAKPVEEFGEKKTERVDTVTFSTSGKGIAPGQFQDFGLSLKMPDKPSTLTFKALQTYSNGEVVRWIGPPDADEPAPQVKLTAANAEGEAAHAGDEAANVDVDVDEDDGDTLAVIALIVGGLGLLAGAAGSHHSAAAHRVTHGSAVRRGRAAARPLAAVLAVLGIHARGSRRARSRMPC